MTSGAPYRRRILPLAFLFLLPAVACGGDKADREVSFTTDDYAFHGLEGLTLRRGDKVTFTMRNNGPADHEFEVFGPDGKAVDEIEPVHAGKTESLTLTFDRPGTYRFACGVSDHEERGMKGSFVVA